MITPNRDQNQIKANFESYARSFDDIYEGRAKKSFVGHWVDKYLRKSMFLRFRETLKNVDRPDVLSVLDIGCGSGRYCAEFLKMNKKVIGIDIATEMIKIAEELCNKEVPGGFIEFMEGSYPSIGLTSKFDAAILMGLFDYIENPKRIFLKLKEDVNIIILASFPKKNNFFNSIRKIRYCLFKNCPLYYYSKQELENLFKSCGLNRFFIHDSDREYYVRIELD